MCQTGPDTPTFGGALHIAGPTKQAAKANQHPNQHPHHPRDACFHYSVVDEPQLS